MFESSPTIKKKNSDTNSIFVKHLISNRQIESAYLEDINNPNQNVILKNHDNIDDILSLKIKTTRDQILNIELSSINLRLQLVEDEWIIACLYTQVTPEELFRIFTNNIIITDPSLISLGVAVFLSNHQKTTTQEKIQVELGTLYPVLGLNFTWMNVLNIDSVLNAGYTEEIFLNAPCFEVKMLPSGNIFLLLTESINMETYDEDYYEAYKKLYNYLRVNRK